MVKAQLKVSKQAIAKEKRTKKQCFGCAKDEGKIRVT